MQRSRKTHKPHPHVVPATGEINAAVILNHIEKINRNIVQNP